MEGIGIDIKFMLDTAELDHNVDKMNKDIRLLKKEVGYLNKELKLDPRNLENLTRKFENLQAQEKLATKVLAQYKNDLNNLQAEGKIGTDDMKEAVLNVEKAHTELLNIQKQLKNHKQMMDTINNQWNQAANLIEKAGNAAGDLGEKLAPVSKVAQDFLSGAIKESIEFEDAFADVEKTVNGSENEFAALKDSIRDLATYLPTSADELARIAGLAGQMNVPTDQIIKFTRAIVDFGNATDITAEEATKEIAQIYNVIGKGGDFSSLDNLLSTIVELGNNTATTESAIVEMFRNVAAASSRVGMTEQQMAALAATLSSLGLDKGGASAISKIMTNIDKAVDAGGSKLAEWGEVAGMTASKFKELWNADAAAGLLAVVEGIAKSNEEGTSFNKTLEDLGIKEIRQVDTLSRLVNAHQNYADNIEMANNAYKEGTALSAEAEKRYKTMASQLQILKNNFLELAMSIGDVFMPLLQLIVDVVKDLADRFNALSPEVKEAIAKFIAMVAVMSPLLLMIKKFLVPLAAIIRFIGNIRMYIQILIGVIQALASLLSGLFIKVVTFIGTNTALTAGILFLVSAFIILYNNCDGFRELVDRIIQKIKDLWEQFKQTNWVEKLGEKFGWFGEIIGGLIELVKTLFGWFQMLIDKALEFLGIKSSVESAVASLGSGGRGGAIAVINSGGYGALNSGGYSSGGITLNASFNVSSNNVTREEVRSWATWIADDINTELGRRIR